MENKLAAVTEQLEKQIEITKSAERRAQRMESDYLHLEGRLRKIEEESTTADVIRDGLRMDKDKVRNEIHILYSIVKLS